MQYPLVWQFLSAFIIGSSVMVGTAFAWPKLTSKPRPEILTKVRTLVGETEAGKKIADVLGVSDETKTEPLNIASVAATGKKIIIQTVETQAQEIVNQKVVEQVITVYRSLPEQEQKDIQQTVCK